MAINEVFPSPTVKQVIFQVRFPNLFYLESRMGEFQLRVMKNFPKSSMALNRQFLIAQGVKIGEVGAAQGDIEPPEVEKVWNFESETGVELHVKADSMDLSSTLHKTYNNQTEPNRFRDSIMLALDALIGVAPVPVFTRVGLRYIDDCPVPAFENAAYLEYYNSTLALDKFNLPDVEEMNHVVLLRRGPHSIRIRELLRAKKDKPKLTLDFDAYSGNVEPRSCLALTDNLHDLVVAEYARILREPVFQIMRQTRA
jgi:uncharacterized protein (TIGR04255 family)